MHAEDSIEITAPAETVWRLYSDVERWPDWTASMDEISFVRGHALEDGAAVRIKQPRLPRVTWQVTELTPGRSWAWEARSPGAHTVARHVVIPLDESSTRVEQSIDQTGPLSGLIGRLMAGTTRRYLRMEAEGLKAAAEQPGPPAHPPPPA
jgi:uncharacterized membrane protein